MGHEMHVNWLLFVTVIVFNMIDVVCSYEGHQYGGQQKSLGLRLMIEKIGPLPALALNKLLGLGILAAVVFVFAASPRFIYFMCFVVLCAAVMAWRRSCDHEDALKKWFESGRA